MTSRTFPLTRADRMVGVAVTGLAKVGLSLLGSRVLAVRGRKSGELRTVPVNLLTVDGQRYLVAPRGQVQWVRNLRVAGEGELRIGRRTERFVAEELADSAKVPVLREYLRKWAWEVGRFFDGLDASSDDAALLAAAPDFPAFRVLAP
ncbi:nitroreductase/quinone reductase family protein [Pseudonocardia sp. CA-107938]|uniref:nitroreductase/quinone reductase family protein n=1 Tax=Pseudonocardia sp. CA-107938 TaxID=3240021 RepID=UPI003D8D82E3